MNAIMVIHPYLSNGVWVFDDHYVGLVREPFVSGVPEIINRLLAESGIKEPEKGFNMLFSASPFPGYSLKAVWTKEEFGGNWYSVKPDQWKSSVFVKVEGGYKVEEDKEMFGWLCPAILKYFNKPPKTLYVRAESINK